MTLRASLSPTVALFGEQDIILVKIAVDNVGDNAHNVKIVVSNNLNLLSTSTRCATQSDAIECEVGTVQNTTQLQLPFSMSSLDATTTATAIVFTIRLSTSNAIQAGSVMNATIAVPIARHATFDLTWTAAGATLYDHPAVRPDDQHYAAFTASVNLVKDGPSPVQSVAVRFAIPAMALGTPITFAPQVTALTGGHCNISGNFAPPPPTLTKPTTDKDKQKDKDSETAVDTSTTDNVPVDEGASRRRKRRQASDTTELHVGAGGAGGGNGTTDRRRRLDIDCSNTLCYDVICAQRAFGFGRQSGRYMRIAAALDLRAVERMFGADHTDIYLSIDGQVMVTDALITKADVADGRGTVTFSQRPYAEQPQLYVYAVGSTIGLVITGLLLFLLYKVRDLLIV